MRKRGYLSQLEVMVIFAILRTRGDAYGIPIAREITEKGGREIALASIYATLERLESKGLVTSELGEATAQRGGKARTYFKVTAAGIKEAQATYGALAGLAMGLRELKAST